MATLEGRSTVFLLFVFLLVSVGSVRLRSHTAPDVTLWRSTRQSGTTGAATEAGAVEPVAPVREELSVWWEQRATRECVYDYALELNSVLDFINKRNNFALVRVGDGEFAIARGQNISSEQDAWAFRADLNPALVSDMVAALQVRDPRYLVGLPCLNWRHVLDWYHTFAHPKIASLTSAIVFVDGNYERFFEWFNATVVSKAIPTVLIAGEAAREHAPEWPLESLFYSTRELEVWETTHAARIAEVSALAKRHTGVLFAVSLGPVAKVLVHHMWRANAENMYVDFGSAIDFFAKGKSTRPYAAQNDRYGLRRRTCEGFRFCGDKACACPTHVVAV